MNSHYQNAETQYIFATQGRFESNYSSCTGRNSENMKIYVTVEALGKMKGRMKLSLSPKLLEKLVWAQFFQTGWGTL